MNLLARVPQCDLKRRDFSNCVIPKVYLYKRDLTGCNFNKADMEDCVAIDTVFD